MGRHKPGKTRRQKRRPQTEPVGTGPVDAGTVWWGERITPHPLTGRFELKNDAPPETITFYRQMEELLPLYGGSVPQSGALLDEVLRTRTQIGILDETGQHGNILSLSEFAARMGISPTELRRHAHHLHASGALAVTRQGMIQITVNVDDHTCAHPGRHH